MENLIEFKVDELSSEILTNLNGGTFGYDAGWAIHWGIRIWGTPQLIGTYMTLAGAAYDNHYK